MESPDTPMPMPKTRGKWRYTYAGTRELAANEGRDGDLHERVGAPVARGDAVGHAKGEDGDSEAVEEEA
jgi:hypothetical protein